MGADLPGLNRCVTNTQLMPLKTSQERDPLFIACRELRSII